MDHRRLLLMICGNAPRHVPRLLAVARAEFGTECGSPFGVKICFPLGKRLLPDC